MIISTVKQYNTYTINKRRLNRTGFGERLSDIVNVEELKAEIADVLERKGRVYGIYKKKELVGIYVFERQESYFSRSESGVKLGKKEFDFDKFWYGESTAALYFKKCVCLEEVEDYKEKIEKDLKVDLTDYIGIGYVAGVEWSDKLMYRKNLQKKKSNEDLLKRLCLFIIGFGVGWTIFQGLLMAFCQGCLWLSVGFTCVEEGGTQMNTLDLVQEKRG